MRKMDGYAGRILRVNLAQKKVKVEALSTELANAYLGGDGFGARILYDELKAGIDPLAPENKLIFATGPFTCSGVLNGGRFGVFAKSPQTNLLGKSSCGGDFGAELKFAGYDALIVEGKAENPVHILIHHDVVEIKDSSHLWRRDTFETEETIKKEFGKELKVACIGPAGENLVKFSCINSDFGRQAGRTGLGAVMGSKNLKAVAARGSRDIVISDVEELYRLLEHWINFFRENPKYWTSAVKYGTAGGGFIEFVNDSGVLPVKNFQTGTVDDVGQLSPYYWVPQYVLKNIACFQCFRHCGKIFQLRDSDQSKLVVEGPEYETLYSLGSNCGVMDIKAVARAHELCDRLGLDGISTGATVAFAMECFQRGLISREDAGTNLEFGNTDALDTMIRNIAHRKGLGDLLAEGVSTAASKIGKGSESWAMHVKSLEFPAYDPRGMKGEGLAFAVSSRGACHLTSCMHSPELYGKYWKFDGVDRLSTEGKELILKDLEDLMALYDSLPICKMLRSVFTPERIAPLLKAVTGIDKSADDLMKTGERIWNTERLFNVREGATREHDNLPDRTLEEPLPSGKSAGNLIRRNELEKMLDRYYQIRGWDSDGVPSTRKLRELNMTI